MESCFFIVLIGFWSNFTGCGHCPHCGHCRQPVLPADGGVSPLPLWNRNKKIKKIIYLTQILFKNYACQCTILTLRQNVYYLLPLLISLYLISERSICKNQVQWTEFFVYFELNFYCLCACKNLFGNWFLHAKNPVCQTWVF